MAFDDIESEIRRQAKKQPRLHHRDTVVSPKTKPSRQWSSSTRRWPASSFHDRRIHRICRGRYFGGLL